MIGACQNKEKPEVTTEESTTAVEESSTIVEESATAENNLVEVMTEGIKETAKAEEEKNATGVVEDATMNSVVIKMDDGSTLELNKDDETEIISSKGLTIDDKVEVVYEGSVIKKIIVLE